MYSCLAKVGLGVGGVGAVRAGDDLGLDFHGGNHLLLHGLLLLQPVKVLVLLLVLGLVGEVRPPDSNSRSCFNFALIFKMTCFALQVALNVFTTFGLTL